MEQFTLHATVRTDLGKGASRRLRRTGKIPAVIYGTHQEPVSLTLLHAEVIRQAQEEAFYSHILTIDIEGQKSQRAVLKDMQRHPSKPFVMHLDLQRVSETEKLHMYIPLHFINEETCVGVKIEGGTISHQMTEVEIHCLPQHLPEYLEINMAEVHTGQIIHLSDLTLPEGVEIPALTLGDDHNLPVVTVYKGRGGDEAAEDEEG